MTTYVECCVHNADGETRARLRDGDDLGDLEVSLQGCLQRCGPCYETPFLVVDGDLATGSSHEAILDAAVDGEW